MIHVSRAGVADDLWGRVGVEHATPRAAFVSVGVFGVIGATKTGRKGIATGTLDKCKQGVA